jgi:hypothetical protein
VTAGRTAAADAADHPGALPPLDPGPTGAGLARRLVTLAATAIQAGVADWVGAAVLVWHERPDDRPDPRLSGGTDVALRVHEILAAPQALEGVPPRRSPALVIEGCRRGGPPATTPLDGRPAELLRAAGLADVRSLCVAPMTEVGAVALAFLPRPARADDLQALAAAHDLVVDTVRAAAGIRDHLVVPPTRLVIEQAKGVLMAHHGLGPDEAFALLRSVSQKRNVPVRELAHTVVNRRHSAEGAATARPAAPHVPSR